MSDMRVCNRTSLSAYREYYGIGKRVWPRACWWPKDLHRPTRYPFLYQFTVVLCLKDYYTPAPLTWCSPPACPPLSCMSQTRLDPVRGVRGLAQQTPRVVSSLCLRLTLSLGLYPVPYVCVLYMFCFYFI